MAIFLTRANLYRVLQRELPEGVYPDGPASGWFSTADMDSVADVAATAYGNLERIYRNFFPQEADEKISDWVKKAFVGTSFDPNVTLQQKRDLVIAKIRKRPTITLWEVLTLVAGYLPPGKYVQIVENCSATGSWQLGVSELGVGTILGFDNQWYQLGATGDWCDTVANRGWVLGVSDLGVGTSLDEFGYLAVIEPQLHAYGYEIRIFDYAVTGTSYQQMETQINETEPARSVHSIRQNLTASGFGLVNTVPNVDEFSGVDCITLDSGSQTGYSGLTS